MSSQSRLIPVSYYNPKQEIRLSAYADIIVYEPDKSKKILRAIRFGGYPEMVRALADALYAGAGIEATIRGENTQLTCEPKRYQRQFTYDGVYAVATLMAIDDDQKTAGQKDDDGEAGTKEERSDPSSVKQPPRKCMIFCPQGNRNALFAQVDRKTAVPLLPAFQDYILDELERRGILQKLSVISLREKIEAWVLKCTQDDSNIIAAVEDGLKNGAISIPGQVTEPKGFEKVENITGYLNTFGITVAERIRKQFRPLFDPASDPLSEEIITINSYIRETAGYSLYDAQLAVAEAVKCQLEKSKCAFIVAECGSGKTKLGSTAMAAVYALRDKKAGRDRKKTFNIVLCPSHVAGKWAREIAETLPDTAGVVVRSNQELDRLYALFEKGDKSIYAIVSKETARDGYMKQPAVIWSNQKEAFLCPDCFHPVESPFSDDGVRYTGAVNQFFFRTENSRNHKCSHCGSSLWAPVNPDHKKSKWVKIGSYGWVYRSMVWQHLSKTKDQAILEQLQQIIDDPDGYFPVVGACRRYPMSSYIKRRYKGRIDGCIIDELHQYNNDSGQGDAMAEIYAAANKVIGMTATLINGYSSGIFHLLYRVVPALMVQDGKSHSAPQKFDAEYGVVENTYEEDDPEYAANRRTHKRKIKVRQLPGVSPLVYSRFLLEHTAFLSLMDMGKDLPDYEEIPVPLEMEKDVKTEYDRIEKILKRVMKNDRKAAQKILSTYLNLLTIYPDQPYGQKEIVHPISGEVLVEPASFGDSNTIGAKEKAVLDIVQRKVANGERVLVYTSWTRADSQRKLLKLLSEAGYRTEIMSERVTPSTREKWVEKCLASGLQVLITNPSLVETGLDLNAFTTLIFYSMGYNLFTLRQASRRSWRINQTAPRVEVYMLYYKNTMQHKAMKLMASKLAVAGIIEGNFTEEGLAAMSDVQDMTSLMAKELMLGIRDSVEDVAAAFKKMAIINPNRTAGNNSLPEHSQNNKHLDDSNPINAPALVKSAPASVPAPEWETSDLRKATAIMAIAEQQIKKRVKVKKTVVDEDQLSLFDHVA